MSQLTLTDMYYGFVDLIDPADMPPCADISVAGKHWRSNLTDTNRAMLIAAMPGQNGHGAA